MKSKVFLIDIRAKYQENFLKKINRLLEAAGIFEITGKKNLTAIKLHFGELGNTAFIRPVYLREIVKTVANAGGKPFLTDANTLYAGTRSDSPNHLETAIKNGFSYSVVNAPLIIADGLRGKNEIPVEVNRKHFKEVYIGSEIVNADSLLSVAHFKGHELTGFAGTLKNLGMGCASRRGKLAQHAELSPKIKPKKCIGCGECVEHCSHKAISLKDEKAVINPKNCVGCGECIIVCQTGAVTIRWDRSIPVFMEKMVEYTEGVLKAKEKKTLFVNFITDISPACDCVPYNDAPIVRNIGVVASKDPVALDQASVDLVNREEGLSGSCLERNREPGGDKFRGIYPEVDWEFQLDYAESLGIGNRNYRFEDI